MLQNSLQRHITGPSSSLEVERLEINLLSASKVGTVSISSSDTQATLYFNSAISILGLRLVKLQ